MRYTPRIMRSRSSVNNPIRASKSRALKVWQEPGEEGSGTGRGTHLEMGYYLRLEPLQHLSAWHCEHQMKTKRILSVLFLLSLFDLSQTLSVSAAPYSTGEGAVVAARQMAPTGDPNNPFSYPFITTVAKAMIRNASSFPAGLLLGTDAKQGGIDLRPMLLYELGILKSPVKMFASPRGQKKTDEFPSLSVTSIPEASGEMPTVTPRLKPPTSLEGTDSSVSEGVASEAITIRKSPPPRDEKSSLNVDLSKFSIDLSRDRVKNEVTSKLDSNLDVLAMMTPLSAEKGQAAMSPDHAFRFWTVPAAAARPPLSFAKNENYEGSFVMMSPAGLRAVEGRTFYLSSGRLLACSRAKQIEVDTAHAKIKIDPDATAFVEMVSPTLTRIRVIESSSSAPGVSVNLNLKGKSDQFKLSNGDDLIISEEPITAEDKSIQSKSGTASSGDHWNKTTFAVKELLQSEQFFSTDQKNQNPEQRSALTALIKRIK